MNGAFVAGNLAQTIYCSCSGDFFTTRFAIYTWYYIQALCLDKGKRVNARIHVRQNRLHCFMRASYEAPKMHSRCFVQRCVQILHEAHMGVFKWSLSKLWPLTVQNPLLVSPWTEKQKQDVLYLRGCNAVSDKRHKFWHRAVTGYKRI